MAYLAPAIGEWYQDDVEGKIFEVVAIDEKSGSIEVQYSDGNISEFDADSWGQTQITPAAPPEDANAAYEAGFAEDWGLESSMSEFGYSNPLEMIEPDSYPGIDDIY